MNNATSSFHGSDLEKIAAVYGIPKESIISFSANVNPLGASKQALSALSDHLSVISAYPDPAYTELRKAIADYTGAVPEDIILGNGVTELLKLALTAIRPKQTLLVGPTYSQYEEDLSFLGSKTDYLLAEKERDFVLTPDDVKGALKEDTDLVILCNPNNPTSFAFREPELRSILTTLREKNIRLMIDETYVEFRMDEEDISAVPLLKEFDNLLILRGTSKFFATPGLRLGYALTKDHLLLDAARSVTDAWNINAVASFVGARMFSDTEYISNVRKTMEEEKNYLSSSVSSLPGFRVYPIYANFMLVELPERLTSTEVFSALIRRGLMVRNCNSFPSFGERFIRICFMSHEDNVRLFTALSRL
ncbi:MAG: aminotransferase class I/II-fold pyridoxal phosphate-dependent enzyme [Lachnospiraceae bacterium]|nr:aminotransferase class I/II-fold pyridoxal phosphate-dependent enzyme [Lachnospiraceae bacterium]